MAGIRSYLTPATTTPPSALSTLAQQGAPTGYSSVPGTIQRPAPTTGLYQPFKIPGASSISGSSYNPLNKLNTPYKTEMSAATQPTTSTSGSTPDGTTSTQPPGEGYGPGYGEQYIQKNIDQYNQPTALEDFANSQLSGNNPYYDRMRQQMEAGLNQQMAARGHYNSGGALSALGNADAALYAQQFNDMGNLLGQSSNMEMNRIGAGMDAAAQDQELGQGRLNSQFNNLSAIASLGAGTYGGFYSNGGSMSGDAAMSAINALANSKQLQGQGQDATGKMGMDILKAYIGSK